MKKTWHPANKGTWVAELYLEEEKGFNQSCYRVDISKPLN